MTMWQSHRLFLKQDRCADRILSSKRFCLFAAFLLLSKLRCSDSCYIVWFHTWVTLARMAKTGKADPGKAPSYQRHFDLDYSVIITNIPIENTQDVADQSSDPPASSPFPMLFYF